jgi:hypothetical protein
MVGRMAMTEAHHPVAPAEAQALPLLDPREAQRHRRDHIGEVEGPLAAPGVEDLRRPSRPAPERDLLRRRGLLLVERQHPREKPCRARHQKLRPLLLEPAGEAHVIGVVMGDENPPHRSTGKRTRQRRLPRRAAAPRVQPGIDEGPAVLVPQRVDIDVIQRHRQRQAQPEDAGRDLDRLAGRGDVFVGYRITPRDRPATGHRGPQPP